MAHPTTNIIGRDFKLFKLFERPPPATVHRQLCKAWNERVKYESLILDGDETEVSGSIPLK